MDDAEIARTAIKAELEAINLYESLARKANSKLLKETLLSVAEEEKVHVGEFLANVLKDMPKIKEGIKEVCELAESFGIEADACKIYISEEL